MRIVTALYLVVALFWPVVTSQSNAAEPMNRGYVCEAHGVRTFVDEAEFGKLTNASCTPIEYRTLTAARVYSCPQSDGKTIFSNTHPIKVGTKPCKPID